MFVSLFLREKILKIPVLLGKEKANLTNEYCDRVIYGLHWHPVLSSFTVVLVFEQMEIKGTGLFIELDSMTAQEQASIQPFLFQSHSLAKCSSMY